MGGAACRDAQDMHTGKRRVPYHLPQETGMAREDRHDPAYHRRGAALLALQATALPGSVPGAHAHPAGRGPLPRAAHRRGWRNPLWQQPALVCVLARVQPWRAMPGRLRAGTQGVSRAVLGHRELCVRRVPRPHETRGTRFLRQEGRCHWQRTGRHCGRVHAGQGRMRRHRVRAAL